MKKKLVYTFIGILTLMLILYIFRYKQSLTFTNRVPKDATAIININARQLEHHILIDLISHPISYLKSDTIRKKKRKKFSITKGIDIPKNILFFTNNTNYKNVWYSSIIGLNDPDELSRYLESEKYAKNKNTFTKENIVFRIKDKQLIIAIVLNEEGVLSKNLNSLFEERSFLLETSTLLKPIIANASDISFTTIQNDFLEGNFKDGIFEIHGKLHPDFSLFTNAIQPDYNSSSILSIVGKVNKDHLLFKEFYKKISNKFDELTHLSLDSISKNWNGNLSLDLKSIESKTDTIITYEYDDDFNKVEKISTQTIEKPKLTFKLGLLKNTNTIDYLLQQKAIQIIDNDTIFTPIPLYKFYASTFGNGLKVYSYKKQLDKTASKQTKFKSNLNLDRYWQSEQKFSFVSEKNTTIKLVKKASFELSKDNKLSITIHLKKDNRNFLGQLLKP